METWTGTQRSFDMIGVFSGVIEDLTDRSKQGSSDNEPSAHLVRFVYVTSSMFERSSARSGCKNRCAGRWIGGRIGHVRMQKCLHKSGSTRLRDSTFVTACFMPPGARPRAAVYQGFYNGLNIACTL